MTTVLNLFAFAPRSYKHGSYAQSLLQPSIAVTASRPKRNNNCCLGLALLDSGLHNRQETSYFWSPGPSCNIPQLYRALEILAHCGTVCDDTLCACYYAANEQFDSNAKHYVASLRDSGINNGVRIRNEILTNGSDPCVIASIVVKAMRHDAKFDENVSVA